MHWVIHRTEKTQDLKLRIWIFLNYCLSDEKNCKKGLRMSFVWSWKSCSQQTMAMQSASHAPKGQSIIHGMAEECPALVASEDRELAFDLRWWARDIISVYMTPFMVSCCSWLAASGPDGFIGWIRSTSVYFPNPYLSLGTIYSPDDHCGSSGCWKSVFTSTPTRIPRFAVTCAGWPRCSN